ncbi:MAG: glycosyltransferase [Deltaproteobacteria bacterium]|nr:glycosyltransferase [Deltaproteobacteria bacterium]
MDVEQSAVSVIMPVYNHEQYVAQAIESVLNQTYEDLELIILDDASTDNSVEVIRPYLTDRRVKFFRQDKNLGSSETINNGIRMVQSNYVTIINSDDYYDPRRLEILVEAAGTGGKEFLATDIELVDADSRPITDKTHWWLEWYEGLKQIYYDTGDFLQAILQGNFLITTSNFFLKRSVYDGIGYFGSYKYLLDYDFILRFLSANRDGILFLHDQKLLHYRLHGSNSIKENPLKANQENFDVLLKEFPNFLDSATRDIFFSLSRQMTKVHHHIEEEMTISFHNMLQDTVNSHQEMQQETVDSHRKEIDAIAVQQEAAIRELALEYDKNLSLIQTRLEQKERENANLFADRNKKINHYVNQLASARREMARLTASFSYRLGKAALHPIAFTKTVGLRLLDRIDTFNKLNELLSALNDKVSVFSFDLFDTLLVRRIEPPEQVHQALCRHLSDRINNVILWEDILACRIQAVTDLREEAQAAGFDYECRYSEILDRWIQEMFGTQQIDPGLKNWIRERELELEVNALMVDPEARRLLDMVKGFGKPIVALSDMYLESDDISYILEKMDLLKYFDRIYMSSEKFLCKYSGRLFSLMMSDYGVSPKQVVHVGDNPIADHDVPSAMAIRAVLFKNKTEKKRLRLLRAYSYLSRQTDYWKGRHLLQVAHAGSLFRENTESDFYYRYGYDVLGPVFCTYIFGILDTLAGAKAKRIFFLARDGYLLQSLYRKMISLLGREGQYPEDEYLYLTRMTTSPAAVNKGLSHLKAMTAFYNPRQKGVYSVLKAFGLPPEEFEDSARRAGFDNIAEPIHNWHDPRLLTFIADDHVQAKIKDLSQPGFDILQDYLSQHGFFSHDCVGLVDVGWNATIQYFLGESFSERNDFPTLYGCYMGYCDGIPYQFPPRSYIEGVMYDARRKLASERAMMNFVEIFEEAARATHATTINYYYDYNGQVQPVLKGDDSPDRQAEIEFNPTILKLQNGILDFCDEFVRAIQLTNYSCREIKPFIMTLIERAVVYPTSAEVKHFSNLVHSDDWGSDHFMDLKELTARRMQSRSTTYTKLKQIGWHYSMSQLDGEGLWKKLLYFIDICRHKG